MKKSYIFLTLFVIILVGGMYWVFQNYEKPAQEVEFLYSKLTLFASDESTGDQVITGYQISGDVTSEASTLPLGDILILAPVNSTLNIQSYNLEDQDYYSFVAEPILIEKDKDYRVHLKLKKPQEVLILHEGSLGDEELTLSFRSSFYKNPLFCLKWGTHIIKAEPSEDFKEILKPVESSRFDKCYEFGKDLEGLRETKIKFTTFGDLDKDDFLEVLLMDRDVIRGEVVSLSNEIDIGGANLEYLISP